MSAYLLHHLLNDTSSKYPDKEAVIFKEARISYGELESKSNALMRLLNELGLKTGDRVGILLQKSIESIVAIFGILKAGGVYVPIEPLMPLSRIHYIMKHCGIRFLIASSRTLHNELRKKCVDVPLNAILLSDRKGKAPLIHAFEFEYINMGKNLPEERHFGVRGYSDVNPAYILYTSGSTGQPKGVLISHLNALAFVDMASEYFKIEPYDRLANHAPLHFDLSAFDIFSSVKQGATLYLVPEFLSTFPMRLAEYISTSRVTIWNSVSSVLTMLADKDGLEKFDFSSLRLVHFSGDVLPVKYLRLLMNRMPNAKFYNIYGQTEANSSMCYCVDQIPEEKKWRIPIGKPFPNFEVFALNEMGREIAGSDEEGELYVKSATVAMGYWLEEERTREKFVRDPRSPDIPLTVYRTGDLVKVDTKGNYTFVGRKDQMVKSRGYRIELEEIEAALNSHPAIKLAAVMAIPDELIGHKIVANICFSEGEALDDRDMASHCSKTLPSYMIPEIFIRTDWLPLASNGKIDRIALREACLRLAGRIKDHPLVGQNKVEMVK